MIKPIGERLLVLPDPEEKMSPSGLLHLPEESIERPKRGLVIAVGRLVERVAPGDRILFGNYDGTWIEYAGKRLAVIREPDVEAIEAVPQDAPLCSAEDAIAGAMEAAPDISQEDFLKGGI